MSDVNIQTISVSPTVLSGLEYLVLLNGSETEDLVLQIDGSSENQILRSKQTLTFVAELNSVLPNITLSGNDLTANIVTTEKN
jgi:hypothetical protein